MKRQMKELFWITRLFASALVLTISLGAASVLAKPWKFGVMSDTQWIGSDDGKNPNTVSVDTIKGLNRSSSINVLSLWFRLATLWTKPARRQPRSQLRKIPGPPLPRNFTMRGSASSRSGATTTRTTLQVTSLSESTLRP